MLQIRPGEERGRNKLSLAGYCVSRFAFDQYYDPNHVQFRSLRVLNEDKVAPGRRLPNASRIATWKSSPGFSKVRSSIAIAREAEGASIRPGELQHMSAGHRCHAQ